MTDYEADPDLDPTHGLAVLADPLDPHAELPALADIEARFERISSTDRRHTKTAADKRTPPRVLALAAVSAAALLVAVSLIVPNRRSSPAAALILAVEQTDTLTSGSFTVDRVMTAGGRTLTQTGRVSFNGDDYTISYRNNGGIIDPTSGVTPPSIEFREVDGVPYVGTDRGWVESIDSPATHPMRSLSSRLTAAAATADDLDRCQDQTTGVNSYCLTTDDPLLIATLQPGLLETFESANAMIRIDVDDTTGRLARIVVDATDVVASQPVDAPGPGVRLPIIDMFHSESSFDRLDQVVTIEVPDLSLRPPVGDVPWQCDGLQHSEDIVECLRFWGEPDLADYYDTLDLEPSDPPPPGVYGDADVPYKGLDD